MKNRTRNLRIGLATYRAIQGTPSDIGGFRGRSRKEIAEQHRKARKRYGGKSARKEIKRIYGGFSPERD